MKRSIIVIFVLLGSTLCAKANDTALYKKRMQKIRQFHEWLSKRPYEKVNVYEGDTNSGSWIVYDTAINVFFNRKFLDSAYEYRENDIFSKSAKFQLLKQMISDFHHLSVKQCFDSLKFKNNADYITQYFLIDNKDYQYTAFGFFPDSDEILGMALLGMPAPEYQILKRYYESLKPCLMR
jgi:hypothetical protein